MGRFYRAAQTTPIDYMYRLNTPLMEKVLETNDQYIDQSLAQTAALKKLGMFLHIPGVDDETASKLAKQYQDRADEIANAINSDPANWRKQTGALQALTKDLQTDYATGAISKYVGNYNQMQKDFTQADKQAELWHTSGGTKGVDPIAVNLWKQHTLNNFKGTANSDGPIKYNTFTSTPLSDNIDLNKVIDDTMSKVLKDSTIKEFTNIEGGYFNDQSHSWKGIPPDKIMSVVMNRIYSDSSIMHGLSQYQNIGYIKGLKYDKDVLDENGNVIHAAGSIRQPFSQVKNDRLSPIEQKLVDEEQHRINILRRTNPKAADEAQKNLDKQSNVSDRTQLSWDSDSYLTPFVQAAINKYGGAEIKDSSHLRNNSLFNLGVSNAAAMSRLVYGQNRQDQRQNSLFRQQEKIAGIKHNYDMEKLQAQLEAKANNGKGVSKAGDKNVNSNSIIGSVTSNPWAFLGSDPNKYEANIQSRVQNNIEGINNLYKEKNKAKSEGDIDLANFYGSQIKRLTVEQMSLGQMQEKAKENAIQNVVPQQDLALYNNATEIKRKFQELQSLRYTNPELSRDLNYVIKHGAENSKIISEYNKVKQYQSRVESQYKNNLANAAKSTTTGGSVIETTNNEDNFLRTSMATVPSAYKITNPKTGETSKISFENGGLDPFSQDIVILGVAPESGPDGGGMVIHTKIKGQDVNIHPVGPTAQSVEQKLLGNWSKSTNQSVRELANTMSNPYYKAINEATTGIAIKDNNPLGLSSTTYKVIGLPAGQAEIGVTKIGTTGFKLQMKTKNGWQNIPPTDDKGNPIGNYFTTDADMVDALQKIAQRQEAMRK